MKPVLILGAGINGCAVARDLAINGIPVVLVDKHDIAYSATSRSSRLIHGGLRYLENRDIGLVRESLQERERLLNSAPQFVRPLRLSIPIQNRFGGLVSGALNYLGFGNTRVAHWAQRRRKPRGLWAVRTGLAMYDALAKGSSLPKRSFQRTVAARETSQNSPPDPSVATTRPALAASMRWVCEYSDAQMELPERFCVALLQDSQFAAREQRVEFEVLTRSECRLRNGRVEIRTTQTNAQTPLREFEPSVIVNATGASGDLTLSDLGVEQPAIFAGTKGTHLFTTHAGLKAVIGTNGIYAEANDGRLVFILPCASGVLIGTTDEHFSGTVEEAASTQAEVEYLIGLVRAVFPSVQLQSSDIEMAHAGVRPLPKVTSKRTSDIPRGHAIALTVHDAIPVFTLIGGKLTTCRSLAEEVTDAVLNHTSRRRQRATFDRPVPGGVDWPTSASELNSWIESLSSRYELAPARVATVLRLCGDRFEEIFGGGHAATSSRANIVGTEIPIAFAVWSIETEWVASLDDLVERRLALIFAPNLKRSTLFELAQLLVDTGKLDAADVAKTVDEQVLRLAKYYSKTVLPD